jgi:hypothetical protein
MLAMHMVPIVVVAAVVVIVNKDNRQKRSLCST